MAAVTGLGRLSESGNDPKDLRMFAAYVAVVEGDYYVCDHLEASRVTLLLATTKAVQGQTRLLGKVATRDDSNATQFDKSVHSSPVGQYRAQVSWRSSFIFCYHLMIPR